MPLNFWGRTITRERKRERKHVGIIIKKHTIELICLDLEANEGTSELVKVETSVHVGVESAEERLEVVLAVSTAQTRVQAQENFLGIFHRDLTIVVAINRPKYHTQPINSTQNTQINKADFALT